MNEREWLSNENLSRHLHEVGFGLSGRPDGKPGLLYMAAVRRHSWYGGEGEERSQAEVELAIEEGGSPFVTMHRDIWPYIGEQGERCPPGLAISLLREVVGNPFRDVVITSNDVGSPSIREFHRPPSTPWSIFRMCWKTPVVIKVAQTIYDEQSFHEMGILHDALLDAGCDNMEVLHHLQDMERCPECVGEGDVVYATDEMQADWIVTGKL